MCVFPRMYGSVITFCLVLAQNLSCLMMKRKRMMKMRRRRMSWSFLASSSLTSPQCLPAHSLDSFRCLAALAHVGTELLIGPCDDLWPHPCSLPGTGWEREALCLVPCDLIGWKECASPQTGTFSSRQSLGPAPSPPSSPPTLSPVQACGSEPFQPSRPHPRRQMNQSPRRMRRRRKMMNRSDYGGRVP